MVAETEHFATVIKSTLISYNFTSILCLNENFIIYFNQSVNEQGKLYYNVNVIFSE